MGPVRSSGVSPCKLYLVNYKAPSDTVPSELCELDPSSCCIPRVLIMRRRSGLLTSVDWLQRRARLNTSPDDKFLSMCRGKKHLTQRRAPHPVQNVAGREDALNTKP